MRNFFNNYVLIPIVPSPKKSFEPASKQVGVLFITFYVLLNRLVSHNETVRLPNL